MLPGDAFFSANSVSSSLSLSFVMPSTIAHIHLRERPGYSAKTERIMMRSKFTIMGFLRILGY
jgi:hypothetical protein